ncbi:hypothetical protein TCSYLVIO_004463 [Trypanosoma cruzi]|nr:hypothetical protein TCSYLVIO_004463 [Trypanosoma cruzi]
MDMSPGEKLCDGCGNPASSFQCPLCRAEIANDRGFFCGQECFAKNWRNHRNTFHKKGVVRAKQPPGQALVEAAGDCQKRLTGGTKEAGESIKKRRKLEKEVGVKTKRPGAVPWLPPPRGSPATAEVTPPLPPETPRAVVGCPSADRRIAFWSAAVAASHHIAAAFSQGEGVASFSVLVVTSSPLAAHAMAWAARCAGLAGVMRLIVNAPSEAVGDNLLKHTSDERRVIITTQEIVRCVADGSVAVWLPRAESLLVTLPGVVDACDLQAVHVRAVFFVGRTAGSDSTEDNWCVEEEIVHHVSPPLSPPAAILHQVDVFSTPTEDSSATGDKKAADTTPKLKLLRFDNDVSTSLSRGDLSGALQHLVGLYSASRGMFEEVFLSTFLSALGAASVTHAHHMLAYAARYLVDHSARFAGPPGGTLKEMTLRAVTKVVRLFPPIKEAEEGKVATKKRGDAVTTDATGNGDLSEFLTQPSAIEKRKFSNYYETLPNLQLQATICYLYEHAPPGTVDAFGAAWGVDKVLPGLEALKLADRKREDAVQRLRNRYGSKLSSAFANYLVVLMHFIYDAVAGYSLAVEELERRTLWSLTLEPEVGSLRSFLSNCFLLQKEDTSCAESKRGETARLSSRKVSNKPPSRTEILRSFPVRTSVLEEPLFLSWLTLPLVGKRQRDVERLQRQAVEEILMAMPRNPRPMYIGDVGNLIGKWNHFNSRFEGALGVSLMEFLMQHPEHFRVVGNLVTRRSAGVSEQVRMRFDNDDSGDDDDNGKESDQERKAKDRALLTGVKGSGGRGLNAKDLPARARKKATVKAFNKARFNRNYKPMDPAAKVPGYVKHGPRKVKGRGRKVNKRVTKRGG